MAILNTRAADYAVDLTWVEDYTIDAPGAVFAFNSSAIVIPVVFAASELSSSTALTLVTTLLQASTATVSTSTVLSSTASGAFSGNVVFDSLFAPTVIAQGLRNDESLMQVHSNLSVTPRTISNRTSEISAAHSVQSVLQLINDTSSMLNSSTQITAQNQRVVEIAAAIASTSTVNTVALTSSDRTAQLASTSTLTGVITGLIETNAQLFAFNSLSVGVQLANPGVAVLNSTSSINSVSTRVQPADSTIDSTAQITALNDAVLSTTSALTTTTLAQIHSVVIKNVSSTPVSTAVLAAVPQRVVVVAADLGALFTPTVIANIGRADPSRTWTINPETRTVAVLTEDRTLIVLQAAS